MRRTPCLVGMKGVEWFASTDPAVDRERYEKDDDVFNPRKYFARVGSSEDPAVVFRGPEDYDARWLRIVVLNDGFDLKDVQHDPATQGGLCLEPDEAERARRADAALLREFLLEQHRLREQRELSHSGSGLADGAGVPLPTQPPVGPIALTLSGAGAQASTDTPALSASSGVAGKLGVKEASAILSLKPATLRARVKVCKPPFGGRDGLHARWEDEASLRAWNADAERAWAARKVSGKLKNP